MARERARNATPQKSALMKSADVSKEEKHVSFGSDIDVVGSDNPSHWTDCFHEPDGTHPRLLVSNEPKNIEQEGRESVHEQMMKANGRPMTIKELAVEQYSLRGHNDGAELLR